MSLIYPFFFFGGGGFLWCQPVQVPQTTMQKDDRELHSGRARAVAVCVVECKMLIEPVWSDGQGGDIRDKPSSCGTHFEKGTCKGLSLWAWQFPQLSL